MKTLKIDSIYQDGYNNSSAISNIVFNLSLSRGMTIVMGKNTLLVTAAVWRDPQLTVTTSHDVETSSSAGNAWIDMNTSSFSSPPSASTVEDAPAGEHKLYH